MTKTKIDRPISFVLGLGLEPDSQSPIMPFLRSYRSSSARALQDLRLLVSQGGNANRIHVESGFYFVFGGRSALVPK